MTAITPTDNLFPLLFDSITDGILCLDAVRDDTQVPIDFRVSYQNASVQRLLTPAYRLAPGSCLMHDNALHYTRLAPLFASCVSVLTTGVSAESTFCTHLNQQVRVGQVRVGESLILTLRPGSVLPELEADPVRQAPLLKGILNASLNGIIAYRAVRDADGTICDFVILEHNEVARLMMALPTDALGQTLLNQQSSVRLAELFTFLVGVVETGEPFRLETPYDRHGLSDWFDISVVKLDDGFVITFIDITELRLATRQTERQTSLLQSILNTSLHGIIAYQAIRDVAGSIVDFRIQLVNNVAYQQGVTLLSGPSVGRTLKEFSPGTETDGSFRQFAHVCNTGEPFQGTRHYVALDQWADVAITKLDDGVLVTFNNVTEAKRAEVRVQQQAELLNSILDNAIYGIISCTVQRDSAGVIADFMIQTVNRPAAVMVGGSIGELPGQSLLSSWALPEEINPMALYRSAIESGQPQRREFRIDGSDSERWLDVLAAPLNAGLVVTLVDITETKQAELNRQALITELQRSNANLEQFAYVASHDLQEPLRKVIAFGDVLQEQFAPALSETGVDMIKRMQTAANRMQVLIKDLLTYSRVASKRDPFRPIDINRIVTDVLVDLETTIHEKAATITMDSLPKMPGDAMQIRQLFQNLLSNALKFSRPGIAPVIHIDCRPARGHEFDMVPVTESRRRFYCIDVHDNGIGFEPKYAERIFQVFQRLHSRSQYAGTGIGLAIVQKVVENHKGYVSAVGHLGTGTTFKILLPMDV